MLLQNNRMLPRSSVMASGSVVMHMMAACSMNSMLMTAYPQHCNLTACIVCGKCEAVCLVDVWCLWLSGSCHEWLMAISLVMHAHTSALLVRRIDALPSDKNYKIRFSDAFIPKIMWPTQGSLVAKVAVLRTPAWRVQDAFVEGVLHIEFSTSRLITWLLIEYVKIEC